MALTHLVSRSAKRLAVVSVAMAHLDHALRPNSGEDAAFVTELGARLGLPVISERRPVRVRRGESPEAAARRVRYAFLVRAAKRCDATVVLTAHHMDDQAETVLLRILRGTGPAGLAAIPASRPIETKSRIRLVRPLLPFRRERLREWLTRWKLPWREDPTNVSGNVRSRLRNFALPILAECSGRDPVPLLARLADHAALELTKRARNRG